MNVRYFMSPPEGSDQATHEPRLDRHATLLGRASASSSTLLGPLRWRFIASTRSCGGDDQPSMAIRPSPLVGACALAGPGVRSGGGRWGPRALEREVPREGGAR